MLICPKDVVLPLEIFLFAEVSRVKSFLEQSLFPLKFSPVVGSFVKDFILAAAIASSRCLQPETALDSVNPR